MNRRVGASHHRDTLVAIQRGIGRYAWTVSVRTLDSYDEYTFAHPLVGELSYSMRGSERADAVRILREFVRGEPEFALVRKAPSGSRLRTLIGKFRMHARTNRWGPERFTSFAETLFVLEILTLDELEWLRVAGPATR